jgi:hypothetical protein
LFVCLFVFLSCQYLGCRYLLHIVYNSFSSILCLFEKSSVKVI